MVVVVVGVTVERSTRLGPQSRFGGKLLEYRVDWPQNETAVLVRHNQPHHHGSRISDDRLKKKQRVFFYQ